MSNLALAQSLSETADFLARHEQKDLLRFMTCGSVDDGKSTLIGRLLLETGAVYDDQLVALGRDSRKHGTADVDFDPALLLDGLEDERQQGITIDVAYRYFQTSKRKFIIADSPGHEQYTRNMATAASTAQAAIILIDARKGMLVQTRRHSFIASLLGVRTLIVAVNKMDLVEYDRAVFAELRKNFREFASRLDVDAVHYVPLSGLRGDNVTYPSVRTPWYEGPTLLHLLEHAPTARASDKEHFRFPVQRVSRPNADFRGYSGTIVAGAVAEGDLLTVLPSRRQSRVRSIVTFDGEVPRADAGSAVTLTLEENLDIARGDVLTHVENPPMTEQHFDATLVWMSRQPLAPGKPYWLKHAARHTTAEVEYVSSRTEPNTLNQVDARTLRLNEIGACRMTIHSPLVFDHYRHNRRMGSFILVDRATHETVAAGMIGDPRRDGGPGDRWHGEPGGKKLQFAPSRISAIARRQRYGHPSITLLLTGLSGAGKTTLGFALEEKLFAAGYAISVLDGQNLRLGISRDLGFSVGERSENLRRAAEICRLFNDAGMICVAAFVAPDSATRLKARQVIGEERLLHIHLTAPLSVCRQRDASGRYLAAERGEIVSFPGVTAPYEPPDDADLVIQTDKATIAQCVDAIEHAVLRRLAAIDAKSAEVDDLRPTMTSQIE